MKHRSRRLRQAATVGVVLAAVAVLIIVAIPLRTLAEDILISARAPQFPAITVPTDVGQKTSPFAGALGGSGTASLDSALTGLGNFSTTFTRQNLRETDSVGAAEDYLRTPFPVPKTLPARFADAAPTTYLIDPGTVVYTLNMADARAVLGRFGAQLVGLPDPATTPAVTFTVSVPAAAAVVYQAGDAAVAVAQSPQPTLSVSPNVDLDQLRRSVLTIPGLPTSYVAQIRAIRDWSHALILPTPAGASTSSILIRDAPALLISTDTSAAVLWERDGMLYAVAGRGMPATDVVAVANALPTTTSATPQTRATGTVGTRNGTLR